ncbi:hypothetical protein B7494_g5539 [Chlorociboria aeruginascens]|nr:hypothetical protein B7494_g5539 [Chlorociboria aeruginascens]
MILRYASPHAFRPKLLQSVCLSCLRQGTRKNRIGIGQTVTRSATTVSTSTTPRWSGYFSMNGGFDTGIGKRRVSITGEESLSPQETKELPHRRRQRLKSESKSKNSTEELPSNASTTLTDSASSLPKNSFRRLFSILLSLSKPRLSILVVLTAMATYTLYPVPSLLLPSSTITPSLSPLTLTFLTTGTALCAASANTFNMLYEPKWDALMSRTRNRPLVRGLISPLGAAIFGLISGSIGIGSLYYGVNPTVACLGALNIVLYAGIYTPMKRVSAVNTWIGALVGGIPPLMGWAAAAGQSATNLNGDWKELLLGEQNLGGWLLAALLVAWQFPHFMSLSWPIREEYKNAGYKMLAWTNPARNARVALRYSILLFPICIGLCYSGITEWSFAITSTPINAWLVWEAMRFYNYTGLKGSARGLFWASIWHLPVVLVFAMIGKKGIWERVWDAVFGLPVDEEDEFEDEEEEAKLLATTRNV